MENAFQGPIDRMRGQYPRLSANDCFCLVASRGKDDAILLTGDAQLRAAATAHDIEVHGVLWIVDLLHEQGLADAVVLRVALELWRDDPAVFLPLDEIAARLRRLR